MSLLAAVLARGFALSLAGAALACLLRRSSAATRHAVCVAALGAMLAVPLGMWSIPRREVPVERIPFQRLAFERLNARLVPVDGPTRPPTAALPANRRATVSPAAIALGVWAVGALALGTRLLAGWAIVWGWARHSRSLALLPRYGSLDIRVSSEVSVPLVVWAGRSLVLLPETHAAWSDDRTEAVLLHEAAHVRRGDWATLLLSRLALVLHWPNPLAWLLARAARRMAEDAADDAVLRSGVAPADYAAHLLDLAQGLRRPALAVPMAQKADVHRRIHHVLSPRTSRGSANLAILAVASLVLGALFIPTVSLAFRPPTRSFAVQGPPSRYRDIREGKTVAGNAANGFVGRLSNGQEVRIVQVSRKVDGKVEAWSPDGTPIPASRQIEVPHLTDRDRCRTILLRFKNLYPHPEGGLGSGEAPTAGEPSTLVFAGGGNRPGPKPGEWESWDYIGVPKEDGHQSSFTFSLNDEPWTTDAEIAAIPGSKGDQGHLKKIEIAYPSTAKPFTRDKKGRTIQDSTGKYLHDEIRSTAVSWIGEGEDASRMPRVTAKLKNGKTIEAFWNDSGFVGQEMHHRYFLKAAPEAIETVRIETRVYMNVAFENVQLKPIKG